MWTGKKLSLWIVGPVEGPGVGLSLRACAPALGPSSYLLKDLVHLLRDPVPCISPTSCTQSLSRWTPGPRVWQFVTLDWSPVLSSMWHLLYHIFEPTHRHDTYSSVIINYIMQHEKFDHGTIQCSRNKA